MVRSKDDSPPSAALTRFGMPETTPRHTTNVPEQVKAILAAAGPEVEQIYREAVKAQICDPDRAEEKILALIRNTVLNPAK